MVLLARWRLRELVRKHVRARMGSVHRPVNSTCFSDDESEENNEEYASFAQNIWDGAAHDEKEAIAMKLDMETVAGSLHPNLRHVYRLLARHSPEEIAALLGKSKDMIHRYIREIRKSFARAGIYPPNMRANERAALYPE